MLNILEIADDEALMVHEASIKYGRLFEHACEVTLMLSNMLGPPVEPRESFLRFFSLAKKSHTLSLLSAARRHYVQSKLCLRHFLEAGVHAAYALAHPDMSLYMDSEKGQPHDKKTTTNRAYCWLEGEFPGISEDISGTKRQINEQTAHANLVSTHRTFEVIHFEDAIDIEMPFFDREDLSQERMTLVLCAQAGLIITILIAMTREQHGGFQVGPALRQYEKLRDENVAFLNGILSEPRWQAANFEKPKA